VVLSREISDDRGVFVQIYDLSELESTTFVTPAEFSFQVGFAVNNEEKRYEPHIHTRLERNVTGTAEFILVLSGEMVVDFIDESMNFCGDATLKANTAFLQLRGGHAIRTLPKTRFIELKQGPYMGRDVDKFNIEYPVAKRDSI
jgi:hypothetical protein